MPLICREKKSFELPLREIISIRRGFKEKKKLRAKKNISICLRASLPRVRHEKKLSSALVRCVVVYVARIHKLPIDALRFGAKSFDISRWGKSVEFPMIYGFLSLELKCFGVRRKSQVLIEATLKRLSCRVWKFNSVRIFFCCRLLDVAEQRDAAERPVPRGQVRFEVDGADVLEVRSLRFSVNRTLVELRIFAGCRVYRVDVDDRHLLVQHFRLRLNQLARASVQRCTYRKRKVFY